EQKCGGNQRARTEDEDGRDVEGCGQRAGDQRADQRAEALDYRRGAVRSDELFWRGRERGKQGLQRGPEESRGETDNAGKREHQNALMCKRGRRRAAESRSPDERHHAEEALAAKPVRE